MTALAIGILLIVGALVQGGEEDPDQAVVDTPTATIPTATPLPTPSPTSTSTVTINDVILIAIQDYPEVIDAVIVQEDQTISLVLLVGYATNTARAKELGDNFVRLYKSLSDDDAPGKSIGRGKYDYLIGVYYPDEKQIVLGAKARSADRITW